MKEGLKEPFKRLEAIVEGLIEKTKTLTEENQRLKAENARYRKALMDIQYGDLKSADSVRDTAEKALRS